MAKPGLTLHRLELFLGILEAGGMEPHERTTSVSPQYQSTCVDWRPISACRCLSVLVGRSERLWPRAR